MGSICAKEGNRAHVKVQDWKPFPPGEDCAGTQDLPWVSTAMCTNQLGSPCPKLFLSFPFFRSWAHGFRPRTAANCCSLRRLVSASKYHAQVSAGSTVLCPVATSWFCWLDAQWNRADIVPVWPLVSASRRGQMARGGRTVLWGGSPAAMPQNCSDPALLSRMTEGRSS